MNDRIDLSELKRNTDLVALLESYGVALKKRGAEWDGLCIAHTETNPSMQVYVKDGVQKWHCKACGAGGTVIDAIMVLDGCDEITAIKRLQKTDSTGNAHDNDKTDSAETEQLDAPCSAR